MEQVQRLNATVYWLTYSPFLQPFTVRPKTKEDLEARSGTNYAAVCGLPASGLDSGAARFGAGRIALCAGRAFSYAAARPGDFVRHTNRGAHLELP